MDHGGEALVGFVVARGDPAEGFRLTEEIFDPMAPTVEVDIAGNGLRPIGFWRDHGNATPLIQFGPEPIDIEGLVGEERGEVEIFDERLDADAVVTVTRQEAHEMAERIDERHDLGRQTAARLVVRPPRDQADGLIKPMA